jgi:hypothetical protein
MNWRIKIVIAAWVIAAALTALLVRNLRLGGWKDLRVISILLLPSVVVFFFSSYRFLTRARKNSK